jgi:hypothetical protein
MGIAEAQETMRIISNEKTMAYFYSPDPRMYCQDAFQSDRKISSRLQMVLTKA